MSAHIGGHKDDLTIPDAAMDELALAVDPAEDPAKVIADLSEDDRDMIRTALGAAAPHIVAAELRHLADELDVVKIEMREVDNRTIRSSGLGEGIARLRARADELDGGTP